MRCWVHLVLVATTTMRTTWWWWWRLEAYELTPRSSLPQSTALFQRGMTTLMEFAKSSVTKNKDPAATAHIIAKMATSSDPAVKVRPAPMMHVVLPRRAGAGGEMKEFFLPFFLLSMWVETHAVIFCLLQDLFKRAQSGDPQAVESLQDAFAQEQYPGTHALFAFASRRRFVAYWKESKNQNPTPHTLLGASPPPPSAVSYLTQSTPPPLASPLAFPSSTRARAHARQASTTPPSVPSPSG